MYWLDFLTRNVASLSFLGIVLAAILICWRAGSFHPVNVRLLRLFIAKDDVEDADIKKSLADQTALVSFRMTHRVNARTLRDAKNLATFSEKTNIPLYLIGRAGWAFNLRTLTLNPKRVPHGAWLAVPGIFLLILIIATVAFATVVVSKDVLVSPKETDTWVWLSQDDARTLRPFFFGDRGMIDKSSCNAGQTPPATPVGFHKDDHKILCEIWADPALKSYFAKELPSQRRTFLVAAIIFAWHAFMSFSILRQWLAQIELRDLLEEAEKETSAEPKPDGEDL